MTSKEKAKELVDRFKKLVPDNFGGMDLQLAKQCALICVDDIIKAINNLQYEVKTNYWQEVRTEIKILK